MFNFHPKKKFGQNFLKNKDLLKKISELKDFENKLVLEIGPGTGALTEYLLKKQPKKLIAIEKDEELKPFVDLFDTKDQKEGVEAFLEKRKPEWQNA